MLTFVGQDRIDLVLTKETNDKASGYMSIDNCYIASAFKAKYADVTVTVGGFTLTVWKNNTERLADYEIVGSPDSDVLEQVTKTGEPVVVVLRRILAVVP